jgi:two-component system, LytTR family, response regulator
MTITVFLADDEPVARRRLRTLLAEIPWAREVGEAADGATAVAEIRRQRPDVVFLDIRMPELSGLEVIAHLRALDEVPTIVFTTAFDQYAVTAFELEAVDYLLKPFGQRRFRTAIERARIAVRNKTGVAALERAQAALAASTSTAPLERILVRDRTSVIPLAPTEILRIEAQGDYAMVHARARGFLVGVRLRDLELRLPRPPFLRIHRSHIVNLDQVDRMELQEDGRFRVHMSDRSRVYASRARSQDIRRQSR